MDNNFQTSFIPKKPLAEERVAAPRGTSLFSFIATLVFFGALASAAGMYFYESSLQKSIVSDNASLTAAQNAFEPSLITTLQTLDRRMTDANMLLNHHVAVSPIFEALEVNTLKSVQFTKFSYLTPDDPSAPIQVKMSGIAIDYSTIALQSDQLATNKDIHNPIFSNLVLNPLNGTVAFDLTFTVSPDLVKFTNNLDELTTDTGTPAANSGQATATTTATNPFGQAPSSASNSTPAPTTVPKSSNPTAPGTPLSTQ